MRHRASSDNSPRDGGRARSLGKPAAPVEPLNRVRARGYFGQLFSTADDIAAPMRRNETRSLSLTSAFPVNSGTARLWRRKVCPFFREKSVQRRADQAQQPRGPSRCNKRDPVSLFPSRNRAPVFAAHDPDRRTHLFSTRGLRQRVAVELQKMRVGFEQCRWHPST